MRLSTESLSFKRPPQIVGILNMTDQITTLHLIFEIYPFLVNKKKDQLTHVSFIQNDKTGNKLLPSYKNFQSLDCENIPVSSF